MATFKQILMVLTLCFNLGASILERCASDLEGDAASHAEVGSEDLLQEIVLASTIGGAHNHSSDELCHHGSCHFGHCSHLQPGNPLHLIAMRFSPRLLLFSFNADQRSFDFNSNLERPPASLS